LEENPVSELIAGTPPSGGPRERPAYRARIERIFDHAEDTRSLFLRMVEGQAPRYLPGMFISVSIPLSNETRVRPYTITSSPEEGEPFEICFNRVPNGVGVAWLFDRGVGDVLTFTGPFGAFTLDRVPEQEMVFMAEGTAIAPIRPMIRRALAANRAPGISLLYAADRPDHILFRGEIETWVGAYPQFHFDAIIANGGSDSLYARLLEEADRRWVKRDAHRNRQFYLCGVGRGVLRLRDLLRGAGYERRAVRYEQW
jgi:3-ketosteroid 9alpha-monooxygenase subunit B